ncbi:MAG: FecR domain-containing protein [Pyrinomonadaceae bacterium]
MNYKIQEKCRIALACAVLSLAGVLSVAAQTPEPQLNNPLSKTEQIYVVSAKAGGISYITGTTRVERADGSAQILAQGDELIAKDKVNVAANGKIEVLLNPGSYLRVGGDSDFEFTDTALESLSVKLARGSALIEATTIEGDNGANISINTPQTVVRLEKSGLYRINVNAETTEIFVWKGSAQVGSQIVKEGRQIIVGSTGAGTIAKFDRDKRPLDELDLWSKNRADELAKLNKELERSALANTFASISYDDNFSTGYWCYNRLTHRWCYLPYNWMRCCTAYNHRYANHVALNQSNNTPVVVAANDTKSRSDRIKVGERIKIRETTKDGGSSDSEKSSKTRSSKSDDSPKTRSRSDSSSSSPDYSPAPSKSDDSSSKPDNSPSKSDPSPSKPDNSPSKPDNATPTKKDGY